MSLRDVDARFLLPLMPKTAVVLGALPKWESGLQDAGVEVVANDGRLAADLIVADVADVEAALARQARAVMILGGRSAAAARRRGWHTVEYLAVPDLANAEFLVPLSSPQALRYFADRTRIPPTRGRWWRNRIASRVASRWPAMPLPASRVTIASAVPGPPLLVEAVAERWGLRVGGWLASLGPLHAEGRVVVYVFEPGRAEPSWVVKLNRLATTSEPVGEPAALPPIAAVRQPTALGSITLDGGYEAEAETAAAGVVLTDLLRGPFSRRRKLAAIEAVTDWLLELARATVTRPRPLTDAEAIAVRAVASQLGPGTAEMLHQAVTRVPRVFEHGDLWSRNIVMLGRDHISVLDWTDCNPRGLPLRDLMSFLADSLAELDGTRTQAERDQHFLALSRGEGSASGRLFSSIRRMVAELGLPDDTVGPIITLGLVTQAHVRARAAARLPQAVSGTFDPAAVEPVVQRACLWLADRALCDGWSAWRAA